MNANFNNYRTYQGQLQNGANIISFNDPNIWTQFVTDQTSRNAIVQGSNQISAIIISTYVYFDEEKCPEESLEDAQLKSILTEINARLSNAQRSPEQDYRITVNGGTLLQVQKYNQTPDGNPDPDKTGNNYAVIHDKYENNTYNYPKSNLLQ